ncbi:hypothetical protein CBR_g41798 [Chara braunii]|uniref:EF-hand domain-containing protein n=1 Tax=Chara braunii TaxID=69332 RepID=A0A388LWV1_CHABU|nr:hypothetical protein CBR_g41798 [Chara braunii]|eukprot:GBG86733.1 hypothetical protein CBR_g41798 [Chara braunii]
MALTEAQCVEFREAFCFFDRDRDGQIQTKEIGAVMRALGLNPTEADLSDIVDSAAANGKDSVDVNEFLSLMGKNMKEESEDELKEAFKVFDKDQDGVISAGELRHVMSSLGERLGDDEIDEMLKEADPTSCGDVNYDQFVKVMMARR